MKRFGKQLVLSIGCIRCTGRENRILLMKGYGPAFGDVSLDAVSAQLLTTPVQFRMEEVDQD